MVWRRALNHDFQPVLSLPAAVVRSVFNASSKRVRRMDKSASAALRASLGSRLAGFTESAIRLRTKLELARRAFNARAPKYIAQHVNSSAITIHRLVVVPSGALPLNAS